MGAPEGAMRLLIFGASAAVGAEELALLFGAPVAVEAEELVLLFGASEAVGAPEVVLFFGAMELPFVGASEVVGAWEVEVLGLLLGASEETELLLFGASDATGTLELLLCGASDGTELLLFGACEETEPLPFASSVVVGAVELPLLFGALAAAGAFAVVEVMEPPLLFGASAAAGDSVFPPTVVVLPPFVASVAGAAAELLFGASTGAVDAPELALGAAVGAAVALKVALGLSVGALALSVLAEVCGVPADGELVEEAPPAPPVVVMALLT